MITEMTCGPQYGFQKNVLLIKKKLITFYSFPFILFFNVEKVNVYSFDSFSSNTLLDYFHIMFFMLCKVSVLVKEISEIFMFFLLCKVQCAGEGNKGDITCFSCYVKSACW